MSNDFIKLLKPQNVFKIKKRLGPPEDGGYVVPEFIFENCSALFTYGVGNETRFEYEFKDTYKKPIYLFDHTIGRNESVSDNAYFAPVGLGFGDRCKDFPEHYKEFGIDGHVLLKIDIEGGEYEYFLKTDIDKFESTVMGMILEVHWIDDINNRNKLVEILKKISKHFVLCHVHGNNWGDIWKFEDQIIPKVLELTFVNHKFIDEYVPDEQEYPIKNLDIPNNPKHEDINLSFLNTSFSDVILTLTTIPSRLVKKYDDDIMSCLDSLLTQSYDNYEVHFNVPYTLKSTNEQYSIRDSILKLQSDKFKIFRTEDWGPATKSIPTIERITNPNAIIIVVDDDLVYHKDLIVAQIENQKKWSESIVGYDGLRSRDGLFSDIRNYYFTSNHMNSRVDILQHYKSVSYKRRYFENDFFEFVKNHFSWSDDLLFAAYFAMKRRERLATFHESDPEFKTLQEWQNGGGVTTFPVIRHTQHDGNEGCNVARANHIDDNGSVLYKFIDAGY